MPGPTTKNRLIDLTHPLEPATPPWPATRRSRFISSRLSPTHEPQATRRPRRANLVQHIRLPHLQSHRNPYGFPGAFL